MIYVNYKISTLINGNNYLKYISYINDSNNVIKLTNNNSNLNLKYFKELLNNMCSNTDFIIYTNYNILNIFYESMELIIVKGLYSVIIVDRNEAMLIIAGIISDLQS